MPTDYRFRTYRGTGSTCPHARIRSSLTLAKVRKHGSAIPSHFPLLPTPFHAILPSLVCVFRRVDLALQRLGLEKVTQGLARATSHRVLTPAAGTSPRYSVPFFQNLAQDVRLSEHVLQCTFSLRFSFRRIQRDLTYFLSCLCCRIVPPEVLKLKRRRGELDQIECEWNNSVLCG